MTVALEKEREEHPFIQYRRNFEFSLQKGSFFFKFSSVHLI